MHSAFTDSLARVVLNGPLERAAIIQRVVLATQIEKTRRVATKLADQFVAKFADQHPSVTELREFFDQTGWTPAKLLRGTGISASNSKALTGSLFDEEHFLSFQPRFENLSLPILNTITDLANFLELTSQQLDSFVLFNTQSVFRTRNTNYEYAFHKRQRKHRLFEIPNPWLMQIQRQILRGILEKIPIHDCAHGFRKSRSVKTFAQSHVGKQIIWRTDLASYFPSISSARVFGLFRTMGYPTKVAQQLTQLTTTFIPKRLLQSHLQSFPGDMKREMEILYSSPHLPQGAPTSPMLANHVSYRLDCRLHGLAQKFGATFTRYADDLAFSGDIKFKKSLNHFKSYALAIIMNEGFTIRRRKSVIMNANTQQKLTGIVVNKKLNVSRTEYKTLHAILHNCIVHGPTNQNRDDHPDFASLLKGRIEWIRSLNPVRGEKLHKMFLRINWKEQDSLS